MTVLVRPSARLGPAESQSVEAFATAMCDELAANAHKGRRENWQQMSSERAVAELLYHSAKLAYALRALEDCIDPDEVEPAQAAVLEHAADVGNCALMAADVAGVLAVDHHPTQGSTHAEPQR
jgi:hypothetical protein